MYAFRCMFVYKYVYYRLKRKIMRIQLIIGGTMKQCFTFLCMFGASNWSGHCSSLCAEAKNREGVL